jgi:hypothetical protein
MCSRKTMGIAAKSVGSSIFQAPGGEKKSITFNPQAASKSKSAISVIIFIPSFCYNK